MADFQTNLQAFFSKLNSFKIIFLATFILVAVAFISYSIIVDKRGEKRLREIYDLRNEHDDFETLQYDFNGYLKSSYLNTLKYFSDKKEIYLYQAIEDIGEVNKIYNQIFVISRKIDAGIVPKVIHLKTSVFEYEQVLLSRLMSNNTVKEIEIAPIISDQDTLTQELSDFAAQDDTTSDSMEQLPGGQVLNLEEIEAKNNDIAGQIFEINALLKSKIDDGIDEEISNGVIRGGVLILFLVLVLFIVFVSFYFFRKLLFQKLNGAAAQLSTIATGELPEQEKPSGDEFDAIILNSNAIIGYMDNASKFALKIGDGEFNYEFHTKTEKDQLGNALIHMRKRLQEVAIEDKIRNWVNEGQAKFSEILRNTGDDFEVLGDRIISNLVEYINANQGVLYVKEELSEEHIQLDLLSAYAFKRKKHVERKIEVGEGVIGQAFQEKKTIFLKEVKTDHFNIVTGLGESKPSSVLIVPLKNEDDIEGVIEIASFDVFKDYQIQFVEKLGESIASSIKSGKINNTTKQLLAEMQTREEEMKAQEEELKQNMEELSATQEQLERLRMEDESRKHELEAKRATLYDILDHTDSQIYLKDDEDKFVYVNKWFADALKKSIDGIVGKTSSQVLEKDDADMMKQLEIKVLAENTTVSEKNLAGKTLTISAFYIKHLERNGVLGIIK